jgi:hypothetical protein
VEYGQRKPIKLHILSSQISTGLILSAQSNQKLTASSKKQKERRTSQLLQNTPNQRIGEKKTWEKTSKSF